MSTTPPMLAAAQSLVRDHINHLLEPHTERDDIRRTAHYMTGAFALCSRSGLDPAAADLLDRVSDRLLEISRLTDDTARRAALAQLHAHTTQESTR